MSSAAAEKRKLSGTFAYEVDRLQQIYNVSDCFECLMCNERKMPKIYKKIQIACSCELKLFNGIINS